MRLLVVAGHGAGDPGAVGHGFNEAERVRALASRMKALGGNSVILGDTNVDWYASGTYNSVNTSTFDATIELHMDSAGAGARGGHVIIKSGFNADNYDNALANFIGGYFPGRSSLIVGRNDLANPNRCAARGINYRLLEVCFISDFDDLTKFNNNLDAIAKGILSAFGIGVSSTPTPAPTTPKPTPTPAPSSSDYLVKVVVNDGLNVRTGPGTNNAIVTSVKNGEVFTIVQTQGNWGKLKSGAGWICLDYTQKVSGSTAAPKSTSYLVKVTSPDGINIRKGPGTDQPRVGGVNNGEVYTIVETKSNWGRLKSGAGWICLDYVKRV